MKGLLYLVALVLFGCAVADEATPPPLPVPNNDVSSNDGSLAPAAEPPSLEDVLLQLHRMRAEFELEKRFRHEIQSLAAVNSESIRRLQRSLLVSARDHRESFSRVRVEQVRLEQVLLQQSDHSVINANISTLQHDLHNIKVKIEDLEAGDEARSVLTAAPAAAAAIISYEVESKVDNVTQAVNDLGVRLLAVEEHQIILHSLLEESEKTFNSKLRRKIRNLKEDLESRIRDYNGAMTTFASDVRILRQEVERNVNSLQTTISLEKRKMSDSLHLLQTAANQTKDELKENMYYIAKAQQEQMAHQSDLGLEVEDMRQQTEDMMATLLHMDHHLNNVTEMVTNIVHAPSHASAGLVELQLEVLCPHPYIKSGSSCLSILPEHLSWPAAQQRCREMARLVGGEGDMATAGDDTHPIRSFVRKNVDLLPGEPFVWVGASLSPRNEWTWISGETLNHDLFPWGRSEPDPSVDQSYLCIKVSGGALFHNCLNSSSLFAVCQLHSDPLVGKSITFAGLHQPRQHRPTAFSSDLTFGDIGASEEGGRVEEGRTEEGRGTDLGE